MSFSLSSTPCLGSFPQNWMAKFSFLFVRTRRSEVIGVGIHLNQKYKVHSPSSTGNFFHIALPFSYTLTPFAFLVWFSVIPTNLKKNYLLIFRNGIFTLLDQFYSSVFTILLIHWWLRGAHILLCLHVTANSVNHIKSKHCCFQTMTWLSVILTVLLVRLVSRKVGTHLSMEKYHFTIPF